jgi:hypothetical protein
LINPKPDKAARQEIVSKVALGEKEVQVRASTQLVPRHERARLTTRPDLVSEQTTERPSPLAPPRALFFCIAHVVIVQHV